VVAGFVASWRLDLIAPESRPDLYVAWDVLTFMLNALMFLFVGLEIPRRLGTDLTATLGPLGTGLAVAAVVGLARLVWFWPAAYLPLWLFPRLRAREGGYPDPRAVALASWCGVRGAVSLAAALALPHALPGGAPFPGRAEIEAAVLVTIVVTLIGQGSTLGPLVRWLRLPGDAQTESETRKAREAMLAAGIARLDEFCTAESCPIAVYRYRDAMVDQLTELRELDESERKQARRRLEVSRDVRRAVCKPKLRSSQAARRREINDGDHQNLQLEIDREHRTWAWSEPSVGRLGTSASRRRSADGRGDPQSTYPSDRSSSALRATATARVLVAHAAASASRASSRSTDAARQRVPGAPRRRRSGTACSVTPACRSPRHRAHRPTLNIHPPGTPAPSPRPAARSPQKAQQSAPYARPRAILP
jgi:NhaP-type Na+/H+ or K+/H+ antiporter